MFSPLQVLGGYRAQLDNITVHELVRCDPGVKFVEHSIHVYRNESEITTIPFHPKPLARRRKIHARDGSTWTVWNVLIEAQELVQYYFGKIPGPGRRHLYSGLSEICMLISIAAMISAGGKLDTSQQCYSQFVSKVAEAVGGSILNSVLGNYRGCWEGRGHLHLRQWN